MANLMRFDPFEEAWPDLFKNFARVPRLWRESDVDIRLDVTETDREYKVKADVPGVKKEDINVAIDGNVVTISAESRKETQDKNEHFVRSERYYGSMTRSFTLATDVDEKASSAKYANGVLELTLTKKANGAMKRLAVQ